MKFFSFRKSGLLSANKYISRSNVEYITAKY